MFLAEIALIAIPAAMLRSGAIRQQPARNFPVLLALSVGGMLYRYTPTTIAFQPGPGYHYFPSVPELLIAIGYIALPIAGYLFTVKRFAILPATVEMARLTQRRTTMTPKEHQAA